jgi:hypothetical protein
MLASHDLEILSGMVKNELEKLIIKRASDSTSEQDNNLLSEEINKLYVLLSRLIILAEQNVEDHLLNREAVNKIRSTKILRNTSEIDDRLNAFADNILSKRDLAQRIVGTCWRKKNRVEVIVFREPPIFDYFDVRRAEWSSHEYALGNQMENMTLHWKMDNFRATCEFTDGFTTFMEVNNPNLTWILEWAP